MGEPVVYRGPDPPALDRWGPRPFMAGDQQQYPVTGVDRAFQGQVDGAPSPVETEAMEIEDAVGLNRT